MGLFSSLFSKKAEAPVHTTIVKETIMTNFTFTTREEYHAYREDWKSRYAAQIFQIRKAKEDFKQANREFSAASKGADYFSCDKATREIHQTMEHKRYAFHRAKNAATELLVERTNSKIEAGRQRELRLAST